MGSIITTRWNIFKNYEKSNQALSKLKKDPNVKKHLIEMKDAKLFFLSDIKKCITGYTDGNIQCINTQNNMCIIRGRTVLILQEMLEGYGTGKSIAEIVI